MDIFPLVNFAFTLLALFVGFISIGMLAENKRKRTIDLSAAAHSLNLSTEQIRLKALEYSKLAGQIHQGTVPQDMKDLLIAKAEKEKVMFELEVAKTEKLLTDVFNDVHAEPESKEKDAALKALEMRKQDILKYVDEVDRLSGKAAVSGAVGTQP